MPSKTASQPAPRVAFIDLELPYKRHAGTFTGAQRYAEEQGWESTIDEYVAEELPTRRTKSLPYDGVLGRATKKLAERAARLGLPVVNTWVSSPALEKLPGVLTDLAASGRMEAEHLLARGLRRFAALGSSDYASKIPVGSISNHRGRGGIPLPDDHSTPSIHTELCRLEEKRTAHRQIDGPVATADRCVGKN